MSALISAWSLNPRLVFADDMSPNFAVSFKAPETERGLGNSP
ncbi:hypothetical protein [Pseudoalteromonas luteoviolacea]|uniref:Uncharacterized protein n=1 Tax=Pseudoalteromonas luteoviolacea H33 TaxID=1365251 RepID=A0A167DYF9_9GAMM|nr:hypothetical protein [Pseudoalteromonas luteoviolacea]KZN49753.1 hypothetical protein N476_18345 [Pseudoalteromonas luteoviolacea H33]KZN77777.1 hypothetical protein N477_00800 [Pseudoalteromonas luteoviolacea H33-S]